MASENRQMVCLTEQTKIIAGFYLVYVIGDFIFQITGNALFTLGVDYDCEDTTTIVPLTDGAAAYLLVESLILLSFSVMVL
jgi:hypothetical protein